MVVDPYGISVKNAMLLQGDYIRMHGMIQTMIMDMLKKAKVWAVREPQHMFHGLVSTEYLRRYCKEQRTTKGFIIPDIMTQDHPYRQRNGRYLKKREYMRLKRCEWTHVVQYTILETPNLKRSRNAQMLHRNLT